jgi:NIPSNAP
MHAWLDWLPGSQGCLRILTAAALLCVGAVTTAKAADTRLFELRIYTTHPGKLDALNNRFRDHTNRLFVKHGMELVGFWNPTEGPEAENTLVYILAYPNRAARDASWDAFRKDPEWVKAKDDSEKAGPIVVKVDSKFLAPTSYSPMK